MCKQQRNVSSDVEGKELQVQYICVRGLSLTRVLCTDRSCRHLLKCKPTTSATWYIFLLVKALPKPTFPSTSIVNSNWKTPCISISVLGEQLKILVLLYKKGLFSPLESLFFLFSNLALKSFPVLRFASLVPCTRSTPSQIIPLVLGQSGRGDNAELAFPFAFTVLLCWSFLLPGKSPMKQGIVSEAYTNCSHCDGVACFAPLMLPHRVRVDPGQISASPSRCSHWNGWNIPQLCIAVKERGLDLVCGAAELCFWVF